MLKVFRSIARCLGEVLGSRTTSRHHVVTKEKPPKQESLLPLVQRNLDYFVVMDDMDFCPYDLVVICGIIWKHIGDVHIVQFVTWKNYGQSPFAENTCCHTHRCRRANGESPFVSHDGSRELFSIFPYASMRGQTTAHFHDNVASKHGQIYAIEKYGKLNGQTLGVVRPPAGDSFHTLRVKSSVANQRPDPFPLPVAEYVP